MGMRVCMRCAVVVGQHAPGSTDSTIFRTGALHAAKVITRPRGTAFDTARVIDTPHTTAQALCIQNAFASFESEAGRVVCHFDHTLRCTSDEASRTRAAQR